MARFIYRQQANPKTRPVALGNDRKGSAVTRMLTIRTTAQATNNTSKGDGDGQLHPRINSGSSQSKETKRRAKHVSSRANVGNSKNGATITSRPPSSPTNNRLTLCLNTRLFLLRPPRAFSVRCKYPSTGSSFAHNTGHLQCGGAWVCQNGR